MKEPAIYIRRTTKQLSARYLFVFFILAYFCYGTSHSLQLYRISHYSLTSCARQLSLFLELIFSLVSVGDLS